MLCWPQRGTRAAACSGSLSIAHNPVLRSPNTESLLLDVLALTLSEKPVGTDHSLRNLALPLKAMNIHVTLAGPPDTALQQWWTEAGLWYLPLEMAPRSGFRPSGESGYLPVRQIAGQVPRTAASVRAIGRAARDFDVIHSNWLFSHIDAAIAGRLTRTPVVLELHDLVPEGPGRHAVSAAVSTATHSVAVSHAVKGQLASTAQRRTSVIHQGVDGDRFHPSPSHDHDVRQLLSDGNPTRFLCAVIGRQDPNKGLHTAIEAVAQLRHADLDVHLALVGAPGEDSGDYQQQMRQLAQQRLGSAHTFLDHVTDVSRLLNSVDAVLVPSVDEPFGLIALEAQASGCPVIASDSGGLPEFVRHGETGLIARTDDADSFANALRILVTDRPAAERLSNNARVATEKTYRIQQRADAFALLYQKAVKGFQ